MSEENEGTQDLMERLKQQRDELRLKMHLARADARDEWDELETKWERLKERMRAASGEASDAKGDIGAAARELAAEIKKGYERIRAQF